MVRFNIFRRRPTAGTIFLKPSEKPFAEGLSKKTGAEVSIPETGEVFSPSKKIFVSGGAGRSGGGASQAPSSQTPAPTPIIPPAFSKISPFKTAPTQSQILNRQLAIRRNIIAEARRRNIALRNPQQRFNFIKVLQREQQKVKTPPIILQRRFSEVSIKKPKGIFNVVDVVTGGKLTQRNIIKSQDELNKQVEKFNQIYGNRELSESGHKKALEAQTILERNQRVIDNAQEVLKSSGRKKLGKFLYGLDAIEVEPTKENIDSRTKELNKINEKINKRKQKGKEPTRIQQISKKKYETEIEQLQSGEKVTYKIMMGDVPITPIGTATALSGANKIKFIGKQTTKGNKIITDIAFVSKQGKRVGVARGVTISKGKEGVTLIAGRSGRFGVKFPSAKRKFGRVKSFVGRERSLSKPSSFFERQVLKSLKRINVIKRNIKGLIQFSRGQVAQVRGKGFAKGVKFPSAKMFIRGKTGGRVQRDEFVSIASVLKRGDWNKILGRTITAKGRRADFIGFIRGESNLPSRLSKTQKLQYSSALKKVVSTIAAAESKAKIIKSATASKLSITSITANIIKNSLVKKTKTKPEGLSLQKGAEKTKQLLSLKPSVKARAKVRAISKVSQRMKQPLRTRTKQKAVQKATQIQRQGLRQRLKQKLLTKQQQILKQRMQLKAPSLTFGRGRIPFRPIPFKRKKKRFIKRQKAKPQPVFNVFGKSGKKFVRLNKKPLVKQDALSKGAFAIDHTTSKQFKIIPAGKIKKPSILRRAEQNYFNRAGYKLREFRIKKGRAFGIKPRYIEKRKYAIDTRGEKRGLSLAKYLKQQRRGFATNRPKRKVTAGQRRILLQRLKKARAVRMSRLRKGRRR